MIDFRTKKNSNALFINTTRNNNSNACAVYDDIVIDFSRELTSSEIDLVRKHQKDDERTQQILQELETKRFEASTEQSIDKAVEKELDKALAKVFK